MKKIVVFLVLWSCAIAATAQISTRKYKAHKEVGSQCLMIRVTDGTYRIQFYSPEIIETSFIPEGEQYQKASHAVVMRPELVATRLRATTSTLNWSSKGITVRVQKAPFSISFYYNEKMVLEEKRGYHTKDNLEVLDFAIDADEVLYGGGARALGMNRRGHRLQLYNRAHYGYETHAPLMNYTMPLVMSSKKYALHFDNAPIGYLDLDSKKENTLSYETISGRKTYQLIVGEQWSNIVNNYTTLTGKQPMLPRWALGNFASRFGYHSQREVEETIERYKTNNIPVDAVILDLYWFGKEIKGTMGNLEVFRDSFPDFEGMVTRLKAKGVKTITITEPFVLSTSKKWKEAVEKGVLATDSTGQAARYDFYFGNTGLIDIYKPAASAWFWDIYKGLANKGVAGIWGDLGEPEVHPNWVQHAAGTADEVHNIYGHDWAKLIAQGYDREFPKVRPFILMRAGYSGSQRFGMVPWSGDVNRTWGGLQSQPEIALQMGMQGLAFMHSDLGGFAGANLDDELYTRWLQYGVFQPIYRPHAQEEVASEPVYRSKTAMAKAKKSIELRYQLLPYNYNLVFENNQTGMPLMRPLFFEYPAAETNTLASSYLWGNDLLVTPIMKSGQQESTVYLPKKTVWFHFTTGKRFEGSGFVRVANRPDEIPVFVRAGAFIPKVQRVQSTAAYDANVWNVSYYHDTSVKSSQRRFYNDNGLLKNAFEAGAYEQVQLSSKLGKQGLTIDLKCNKGKQYSYQNKQYNWKLVNWKQRPQAVSFQGKAIPFDWDATTGELTFKVLWNTRKKGRIKIKN